MIEYLVERIRTGALQYDDVITRRPDLKDELDSILFAEPEDDPDEQPEPEEVTAE